MTLDKIIEKQEFFVSNEAFTLPEAEELAVEKAEELEAETGLYFVAVFLPNDFRNKHGKYVFEIRNLWCECANDGIYLEKNHKKLLSKEEK